MSVAIPYYSGKSTIIVNMFCCTPCTDRGIFPYHFNMVWKLIYLRLGLLTRLFHQMNSYWKLLPSVPQHFLFFPFPYKPAPSTAFSHFMIHFNLRKWPLQSQQKSPIEDTAQGPQTNVYCPPRHCSGLRDMISRRGSPHQAPFLHLLALLTTQKLNPPHQTLRQTWTSCSFTQQYPIFLHICRNWSKKLFPHRVVVFKAER